MFSLKPPTKILNSLLLFLFLSQLFSPILTIAQTSPVQPLQIQPYPLSELPLPQNNPAPFRTDAANQEIKTADIRTFSATNVPKIRGRYKLQEGSGAPSADNLQSLSVQSAPSQPEPQISITAEPPISPSSTSPGGEIVITQNIKNKALQLHNDPLEILNFVRTSVQYEPYYGSKKGADATLRERSGNDMDKSSLLITLLRAGDAAGNKKIPSRYKHANIQTSLRQMTDLLGVDDPKVAAQVLGQARIPYTLFTNAAAEPQFFLLEYVYAEAYLEYNEYKGAVQIGDPSASRQWIPLEPTMLATNHFRSMNVLEEMKTQKGFAIEAFFDDYLKGKHGIQKPIEALQQEITNFLAVSTTTPGKQYEDVLIQTYREDTKLEYIPPTLPFHIVTNIGTHDFLPDNLRHTVTLQVNGSTSSPQSGQIFLNHTSFLSDLADQETILSYIPASQADQDLLATSTIYEITPITRLHLRPVIKVRGNGIATGNELAAGYTNQLELQFHIPGRDPQGNLTNYVADTIAKPAIAGNTEAIAINTGRILPPELFADQSTSSFGERKLYLTALNYLDRLEASHDELAKITGTSFIHAVTRAIIFNGLRVDYVKNPVTNQDEPYTLTWQGLRIDSSSVVNAFNRFGTDVNKDLKNFTFPFGLQASYDEASIFEEDFDGTKAISTVKGILLANQGVFPAIGIVKITQANSSVIDTLNLSAQLKSKFYNEAAKGNVIYAPTAPVSYFDWQGVFYISLNPATGSGAYIIGEGLNGGWIAKIIDGMIQLFAPTAEASLGERVQGVITIGESVVAYGTKIFYTILYTLRNSFGNILFQWKDKKEVDTRDIGEGTTHITSDFGATSTQPTVTKKRCVIGSGTLGCDYDEAIVTASTTYGVPGGILKAIFHKETESSTLKPFDSHTYRYEPKRDYDDYSSGSDAANTLIASSTYREFAIGGKNAAGNPIEKGSRLDSLDPPFTTLIRSFATTTPGWGLRTIFYYDSVRDPGSDITFNDLYLNDLDHTPGSQKWPVSEIPSLNFTPQLVLSASYGLGHVLYLEARNAKNPQGRFIMQKTQTPYDIAKIPELGIELAASVLKQKFDKLGDVAGDDCAGWSLAIRAYNGNIRATTTANYRDDVCGLYRDKYR